MAVSTSAVYNFGSGPGMMPSQVLQQAQREMLNWTNSGHSVWEMPFTGSQFQAIADQAREDLRQLLQVPDHFRILFMQGGASAQFSLIPMNLLKQRGRADYVDTGHWSAKAINEARRYCSVGVAASSQEEGYRSIPDFDRWQLSPDAGYCHITSNETVNGVQYPDFPDTGTVPLVADMTSDFLSRPIDFNRFGLVYAGAQKNIGPAGLTIVIIREDLIREPMATTPSAFSYQVIDSCNGRFNTPLTYGVYLAGLVFKWLLAEGGVAAMARLNQNKSGLLYRAIDHSDFYHCGVEEGFRSTMNHCFGVVDSSLTSVFLQQAEAEGLLYLTGHPAAGGVRASVYNAMPLQGVEALIEFMDRFAVQAGSSACRQALNSGAKLR
ncbi:MAG: 3-phosphoserine/phosphohydroxythreonine transaminase [Motiliproteus sp.]|nr:3-phosphoserine/phosphohydroxythreonine transaminase [Motiliproteus sp.]MCW9054137.1 3-phosphoserine/phosphohydroxythreonine transaminase [Motiliproteus sp.]